MFGRLLRKVPSVAALVHERDSLLRANGIVPPGHFYSPIVSVAEANRDAHRIFGEVPRHIAGVDLNEEGQLELLGAIEALYPSVDFPEHKTEGQRFFYENPAYSYSDAIFLSCMMRHLRPSQMIEVGSGYSTCVMLDTRERYLDNAMTLTCIEPFPELVRSLLFTGDLESMTIVPSRLQENSLKLFTQLRANDILFIDSTHVSKTGSDVNYLFFDILPALQSGVFVHIHDVFYPFEYPKEWMLEGRSWNELYLLRSFLQYNDRFSIRLINTYLEHFHEARFAERMPLCLRNRGGSIWLQKL